MSTPALGGSYRRAWLAGIASTSVLVVVSQPPDEAGWLAPLALTPWLRWSRRTVELVLGGLGWGLVSGVALGGWMLSGLTSLGTDQSVAAIAVMAVATFVTGIPAALYGVVASLARRLRLGALGFGAGVVVIEWLRGNPQFGLPWALLGHSQTDVPGVAQLAVVGGVPLVSGFVASVSFALASDVPGKALTRILASLPWIGAYLAVAAFGMASVELARGTRRAAAPEMGALVVQSRIPTGNRWTPSMQTTNLALLGRRTLTALRAAEHRPDFVVWPESSVTADLSASPETASALAEWVGRFGTPTLFGGVATIGDSGNYFNSALFSDSAGNIAARFDKTVAVPIVERAAETRITRALQSALVTVPGARFAVEGTREEPLRGDVTITVAMCFEVIYPELVAARIREDAAAIVNLANDSWYGSAVPGTQQLAYGRFRAIEQRRFLLRVADSGPSAVVDPFGRIVRQLDPGVADVLHARFHKPAPPTHLERAALLGLAALGGVTGLALAAALRRVLQ